MPPLLFMEAHFCRCKPGQWGHLAVATSSRTTKSKTWDLFLGWFCTTYLHFHFHLGHLATILTKVIYSNSYVHSYTDGGGCHARCRPAHPKQFGVQYLAQGHFHMQRDADSTLSHSCPFCKLLKRILERDKSGFFQSHSQVIKTQLSAPPWSPGGKRLHLHTPGTLQKQERRTTTITGRLLVDRWVDWMLCGLNYWFLLANYMYTVHRLLEIKVVITAFCWYLSGN